MDLNRRARAHAHNESAEPVPCKPITCKLLAARKLGREWGDELQLYLLVSSGLLVREERLVLVSARVPIVGGGVARVAMLERTAVEIPDRKSVV